MFKCYLSSGETRRAARRHAFAFARLWTFPIGIIVRFTRSAGRVTFFCGQKRDADAGEQDVDEEEEVEGVVENEADGDDVEDPSEPEIPPAASREVVGPLYRFTSKLLMALTAKRSGGERKNIIVSPLSIHAALNIALLGADDDSKTRREIVDALGYVAASEHELQGYHEGYSKKLKRFRELTGDTIEQIKHRDADEEQVSGAIVPDSPVLDVLNMAMTKNSGQLAPKYRASIERYFGETMHTDERTPGSSKKRALANRLEQWCKPASMTKTASSFLVFSKGDLGEPHAAVLLSVMCVRAHWFKEFSESTGVFYNHGLKSRPVNVGTLQRSDLRSTVKYLEFTGGEVEHGSLGELNFRAVQVSLAGGLSFAILEPMQHSAPGDNKLRELVTGLLAEPRGSDDESNLSGALQLLDSRAAEKLIDLTLPKFKLKREIDLVSALKSLGVRRAFERTRAKFSSLSPKGLHISKAGHRVEIDVNKNGLEAVCVTTIQLGTRSKRETHEAPARVEIEKPFMFVIRYDNTPLLVGQVNELEPLSQDSSSDIF